MMTYYTTRKHAGEINHWEKANSKTLAGAKRECTKIWANGFQDSTLMVAESEADSIDSLSDYALNIVAMKTRDDNRWENIIF
jgi:hypothetical protein